MREGSQLLINIGRRAPECKRPEDAAELINKLEKHVETGKPLQEQRLQKISDLANQLYGMFVGLVFYLALFFSFLFYSYLGILEDSFEPSSFTALAYKTTI